MRRSLFTLIVAAAATLRTATMDAGGWAVVTLDDLPARIEAGRPLTLSFMVRQHGLTPLRGLKASVEATSRGQKVAAAAADTPKVGQYAATITVPRAGEWLVTIDSGFGASRLTLLPLTAVEPGAPAVVFSQAAQGQQLFVAKGCVICHQNDVESSNASLRFAQQLIPRKYQDEFLSRILANPAATLPPRAELPQMPDLNLRPPEIAALVAFINTGNLKLQMANAK